ncbi:gliding motility-associated C-terminal domain-containing protein [Kaistella sp. G5-32]|uniref:Gliding motility-associated C-terminal domain-containing protein n=1 Tax=Kaistella gelatinilytica TaxID=2787636 RepID=A0ABS0F8P1_9FLAO|nr:T9SS type B sorting domain-containing protein [Kaistella gelatinilytica]MBF8456058.1 gliding motility-associated C-terminal domain-containing protein [Kaistella gelatinilytica]
MRNFSVVLFLFSFLLGHTQTVNLFNPADNVAYPSQLYFCNGEKFNLKVDAVATSTGDYAMTKDQPSNYPLTAGGTPITFSATGTDKFSTAFPIGFNFSFYGKNYSKVVAGSNGRLVFTNDAEIDNLKDINTYKDRTFSGITGYNTYSALPSTDYNKVFKNNTAQELNLAQIFFGYTDLIPKSQNSSVNYLYKNIVVGGVNALLVSFQNQIRSNGTGGFSSSTYSSSILLFEDGRVIIYVNNKIEDTYNAILGIQNDDASKFKVPAHSNVSYNYNNGPWKTEGVAWVFTPNQNLVPQFKWFQNATLLGETTNTLTAFAPNDGDVLKVEVTYRDSNGVQVGNAVSDQVTFKKIAKPVITTNGGSGCVSGVTMTVPNDPDLNFEWFRVGNTTVLGTGNSYYATQTGSYFARTSRKASPVCSVDSDPFTVNLNSTIPPFNANNVSLNYCDNTGASSRIINLYDYYPQGSNYTLVFMDGTTVIPNPANFVIAANTVKTLTINVNDAVSGCSINQNFSIRFDSVPAAVNNLAKKYCFGETTEDVSKYLSDLAGAGFAIFDYQYSTDGINYSTNSTVNINQFPKVWVKISPKNLSTGSCNTISTIIFTEDAKVVANAPTTQLAPQCASATQTFDLASLIPQINPDPNVTVTFHNSLSDAENGINPVTYNFRSGLNYTTLYIRVVNNLTSCVSPDHPAITILVYLKPKLLLNSITKKNCQGNTTFNLTQTASNLTDAQSPVTVNLEYYSTTGTLLTPGQILNYDANVFGVNPYIKLIYNTTCNDTVPFNLSYIPKPAATSNQILICEEVVYSLQNFQNSVISNPAQYTFVDASGNPLPASFDVTNLPKTVQFYIKDNLTGCISDVQSVTFIKGGNSALSNTQTDYTLCDDNFDGQTLFNLDSKKSAFTTDPDAVFEYFKDAAYTLSISANYTNDTPFAQTVYLRITLPGFCPSSAKINLIVNTPSKSSTLLPKYFICYNEKVLIDAGTENVSWKWSTGETTQTINLNKPGNYSVELTNLSGCKYTHNFIVSDENQPKIEVINQTNNSIEVIANGGVKPYKYYFNGVPQTSNILSNPTDRSYVIQVESATECFGPPKTVYFIKINNAFTPNADGINDVWKVEDLDKMQEVSIIIIDRNGTKVFESTNPNKTEWDGKLNGRALPTSSYWYIISWYDAVTQKTEQRQGWILLKNRS